MAIPTLTASKGSVNVKRGDTTTVVRAGDEGFELQVCDEITVDNPRDNAYVITGATRPGERDPSTIEGTLPIHYKERRGQEAAFEVIGGIAGGQAFAMLYVDPEAGVILETPLIQAHFTEAVYQVSYDPDLEQSRFTVLQGWVDTMPVESPDATHRVEAGQTALYNGQELADTEPAPPYPKAPEHLFVTDLGRATELTWQAVRKSILGEIAEVVGYNIYRSSEPCFSNSELSFIGRSQSPHYLDEEPARTPAYYRVAAVTKLGEELLQGPASLIGHRTDIEDKLFDLNSRITSLDSRLNRLAPPDLAATETIRLDSEVMDGLKEASLITGLSINDVATVILDDVLDSGSAIREVFGLLQDSNGAGGCGGSCRGRGRRIRWVEGPCPDPCSQDVLDALEKGAKKATRLDAIGQCLDKGDDCICQGGTLRRKSYGCRTFTRQDGSKTCRYKVSYRYENGTCKSVA